MDVEFSGGRRDRRCGSDLAFGSGSILYSETGSDGDGMDRQKTVRSILILRKKEINNQKNKRKNHDEKSSCISGCFFAVVKLYDTMS